MRTDAGPCYGSGCDHVSHQPRPHDLIECECCHRVMRYKHMRPAARRGPFGPEPIPGFVCKDWEPCIEIAYSLYLVALYRGLSA